MKKLILSAILFISMGTVAMAQKSDKKIHKTPEERAQHATDMLDKKLSLTADQKSRIYALNLEDMRKVKEKGVKGEKRDMTAMKAAMDQRDIKINNILDEKQRASYKEWREKRKDGMKNRIGKRKGDKTHQAPKSDKV
jgi:protein CpxP